MDFWVKDEDGKLRKATQDEILSTDVVLLDAEGNVLRQAEVSNGETDYVKQLTDVIKQVSEKVDSLGAIKEKADEMEKQLASYKQLAQKGMPIPDANDKTVDDEDKLMFYDQARQGKRLMDKFLHPTHQIDPQLIQPMARYFSLVIRAGFFQDWDARKEIQSIYGEPSPQAKTAIGASGNVFPVPDIVESEVLAFAREKSVVLQYARVWDMTSDKQSFPVEGSSVSVSWGNTTSESEPDVNTEFELDATELSAYAVVLNATLADARTDIVSWLTEAMAEAAGLEIDNESFNGDGSQVCNGILSSSCGNSVTMTTGDTDFNDITADYLSEMISKLNGLRKQGARFYMHGQILHYIRSLKDSNNRPIFIETVGAPMSGTIWGYPYSEVTNMPSTSAANTAFVAFGNLKYFMVGRRLDSSALAVDPYGLFTTNRTRFKLYQRWGLGMGLANGFVRLLTAAT